MIHVKKRAKVPADGEGEKKISDSGILFRRLPTLDGAAGFDRLDQYVMRGR